MKTLLMRADDILHGEFKLLHEENTFKSIFQIIALLIIFGIFYGAVMGSFGGVWGQRLWQLVISGVKVPLFIICSFIISLPGYFVISTLFGLRSDFKYTIQALLSTLAGLTIILSSFAPLTILWYVSISSYRLAILFNFLMFGSASFCALLIQKKLFQPLINRNIRHLWPLRVWFAIYLFVSIQMAWTLRPFVGSPLMIPQFFRQDAWSNAYIILLDIILSVFRSS